VVLDDQFTPPTSFVVRKPEDLCNPAHKDGGPVADPTAHLTCYDITRAAGESAFARQHVLVSDQFGLLVLRLEKPEELCVPSEKNGIPSALMLDHFSCYKAKVPSELPRFEPRDVVLADQFEETVVRVEKPDRLCTPVDKNGEGFVDGTTHLTCYRIKQAPFDPRTVGVENQFGTLSLEVQKPERLCVPSLKTVID
jgi:hypothetical protein